MDSSFNADRSDDDLSTAFSTETLAERDMIPEGFANTPTSTTDMPVEVIGGGRYLRVDQTANLRANSVTSKIWNHGFEYRSLDHGLRDKYWRCRYCRHNKLFKGNTNTSHAIRHLKKHPFSFGRDREGSDEEEDDDDNTLPNATPSTSAGSIILDLFPNMSATNNSRHARRIQSSCFSHRRRQIQVDCFYAHHPVGYRE
jgi:DNA-directed RNA polymerase subunit RPC12/RpoP